MSIFLTPIKPQTQPRFSNTMFLSLIHNSDIRDVIISISRLKKRESLGKKQVPEHTSLASSECLLYLICVLLALLWRIDLSSSPTNVFYTLFFLVLHRHHQPSLPVRQSSVSSLTQFLNHVCPVGHHLPALLQKCLLNLSFCLFCSCLTSGHSVLL